MNNAQLYLAIGVPIAVNLLFNGFMFLMLDRRIDRLDGDVKILTGKVAEVDTRLSVLEDRGKR